MIVYLKPRAPFTNSVPRSDTLFGAIAWAIRLVYGESVLIELLEQFDSATTSQLPPPFLISSLFPFVEQEGGEDLDQRRTLFLPRPLLASAFDLPLVDRNSHRLFKKLESLNWMSLTLFNSIASGELSEFDLWNQLSKSNNGPYRLHAGAVMTVEESNAARAFDSFMAAGESARNTINRLSVSTDPSDERGLFYEPFVSARVKTGARTGFYFLIQQWSELTEMLKVALRFLGDRGFGGGVSIGRGHCEVEFGERDLMLGDPEGEHLVSFSLLHPSLADRRHFASHRNDCFARIERRKGFIESAYVSESRRGWKPTLIMLAEGTTFPRDGQRRHYGSIFKEQGTRPGLSESLRINGLGYTVPMKLSSLMGKEASGEEGREGL